MRRVPSNVLRVGDNRIATSPGGGGAALSAGTQSVSTGTVAFANSNGITFGMSGSNQITASHNGLTTAMASNAGSNFVAATAAFAGTNASGTIASNGISVSVGNYLTTAMASNRGSDFVQATAAFAGTSASGTIASNGISVSIGPYITTGALSNHSHGNPTLALTNLSGTTASNSAGLTLSLSAAAPGAGGGIAAAAGTQTATSGTVAFANSNGITFGMSNSNQITASHNGLTTAAASDHSHGNPTLNLTNLSGTTASASNGFTLSLSAAAPGGGGGFSINHVENMPRVSISNLTNMTATGITQRPMLQPFVVAGSLTHNVMNIEVSRATSGSNAFTMQAAIYTMANSTQLSRLASLQAVFSNTATASISGIRLLQLSGWETAGTTLSPGQYFMMIYNSATATASMNYSYRGGISAGPPVGVILPGTNAEQTATSYLSSAAGWVRFNGVYTTTTASPPATIGANQIQIWTSARPIYFHLGST